MVTDGGASYAAKKDVPANTALTNTEYWQKLVETVAVDDDSVSEDDTWSSSKINGELSGLKSANLLHSEEIDNTTQDIVFASDGSVQSITHKQGMTVIRTDVFTFGTNTITEVRTLNTGESLTIVTNTDTLQSTITYAAA